jgi:ubiquinone/menaquinone biosynthesis C-methylase UbiE
MTAYEESLVEPLFTPWGELLLERLRPLPGERFLDLATGPGTVARLAALRLGPSGSVVATDLSEAMLSIARSKPSLAGAASIDYRQSPAAPLDVPDSAFDVAACQQALQYFPDQPAALEEMRRALRPGGRLGLAVWSAIELSPVFDGLSAAVRDVFGAEAAERYRGGPWGLSDSRRIDSLLSAAGFHEVTIEEVTMAVHFVGGPAQMERSLAASAVMSDIASAAPAARRAFSAAIASRLEPLVGGDGLLSSETTSQIALAAV